MDGERRGGGEGVIFGLEGEQVALSVENAWEEGGDCEGIPITTRRSREGGSSREERASEVPGMSSNGRSGEWRHFIFLNGNRNSLNCHS